MLRKISIALICMAHSAMADQAIVGRFLDEHALPAFDQLDRSAANLAEVSATHCDGQSPEFLAAYGQAFDAWVGVSHIRVGPSEEEDRAFALAFWPDTKGFTVKSLNALITAADPVVYEPEGFASISIAARGFYALEFLLFDAGFQDDETATYRCDLVRAIVHEIHQNAAAIKWGWQGYQDVLRVPSADGPYKDDTEALREVFKALHTGLQFTSDARLGRPLGTFERPRPRRAEAWRSERSARHVQLALVASYELALMLAIDEPLITQSLQAAYDRAIDLVEQIDDPAFAGVADPAGRFRVEILRQAVDRIREIVTLELAPALGVTAGFNSLDGD